MTDIRMMRGPLANIRPANKPFVPREIVIDDKALGLVWGEARVVANGQWRVQTATPGDAFWSMWRAHKDAIKKLGISVSKNPKTSKFEAVKWLKPSEEEIAHREATVAASWAATSSTAYPAPNGLARYPYQNAGISFALAREGTLIGDSPGLGKALGSDQRVLTPDGWVTIGDIRLGDIVYGRDGKPANVIGVYPQGERDLYRVTFRDGFSVDCDAEHLWCVRDRVQMARKKPWAIKTTAELVRRGALYKDGTSRFSIPICEPIDRPERGYYIEPYLMGALIGDGYLCGSGVSISAPPEKREVEQRYLALLPPGIHVSEINGSSSSRGLRLCAGKHRTKGGNPVIAEVKRLGLAVRSAERGIPLEYMLGSIEQRLELLRGLMDTDGSAKKNRIAFHTKSRRLAGDVVELVQSLGGTGIVHEYDRTHQGKGIEFQVNVQLDRFCPFHLPRKAAQWKPAGNRSSGRWITSIEPIGRRHAVCIAVDNADHLYICQHHIVTHNTSQAIGIIDYSGATNALIICPASLKINWKRELDMWLTRPLRTAVVSSGKRWPSDADVFIINYDILHTFDEHIKALCWDVVVLDESHAIKEMKTRRTRCVVGNRNLGIKKLMAKRRVALTGTPISNRPAELWPILHYLDPETWNSWPSFAKRFCAGKVGQFGFDAKGASNLDELNDRLRSTVMVRRLKEDVLKELPPKTRQLMVLPSTGAEVEIAAELDAYQNLKDRVAELRAKFELAKAAPADGDYKTATDSLRAGVAAAFTEMARARKAVAIAKLPTLIDHVEAALESGNKIVVYVHHREVHQTLHSHFGKQAVGIIGGMTERSKQEAVDRFQRDPNVKVFVGSIAAAGTGITLTASSHIIIGELSWVPGEMVQVEDRLHRIGAIDNVLAQWIVLEGSLDSHIAKTLMAKTQLITQALDVKSGDEQAVDPAQAEFAQKISVFEDEEAATRNTKRQRILEDAEHLTPADCADVHDALRSIALLDGDRARAKNMLGFAKIDTRIGHDLASRNELTAREAALGVRIANKYRRQLPDDLAERIASIWTTLRGDQS